MNRLVASFLVAGAVLASSAAPQAHHSFAMFDNQRTVTMEGTVVAWQWRNPHAFLEVRVPGQGGRSVVWSFEGPSVNYLTRRGWTKRSLKAGDRVSVVMSPLRNGRPGGLLQRAIVNGRPLPSFDANPGLTEGIQPPPPPQ